MACFSTRLARGVGGRLPLSLRVEMCTRPALLTRSRLAESCHPVVTAHLRQSGLAQQCRRFSESSSGLDSCQADIVRLTQELARSESALSEAQKARNHVVAKLERQHVRLAELKRTAEDANSSAKVATEEAAAAEAKVAEEAAAAKAKADEEVAAAKAKADEEIAAVKAKAVEEEAAAAEARAVVEAATAKAKAAEEESAAKATAEKFDSNLKDAKAEEPEEETVSPGIALRNEVSELEAKIKTRKHAVLLKLADFENRKKQLIKERENRRRYATSNFSKSVVRVYQKFDASFPGGKSVAQDGPQKMLEEGVVLTGQSFRSTMDRFNVTNLSHNVGDEFSSSYHERVGTVELGATDKAGAIGKIVTLGWILTLPGQPEMILVKSEVKVFAN